MFNIFWKHPVVSFSLRFYSKKYVNLTSSLYVTSDKKGEVFSALDPHLDHNDNLKDLAKVKESLIKRGLEVDVHLLRKLGTRFNEIISEISQLKDNLETKRTLLKNLRSKERTEVDIGEVKNAMLPLTARLEELKAEFWELENSFVIPYLNLPNILEDEVDEEVEISRHLAPPTLLFEPRSHVSIGTLRRDLEFTEVSQGSYFLKNNAALLELSCEDYLMAKLKSEGFLRTSNVDFAKAFLIEGCGKDPRDKGDVINVLDQYCVSDNNTTHLVGGAALPSFLILFSKGLVSKQELLPVKLFTVGRNYQLRANNLVGLFNALQTVSAQSVIAFKYTKREEDKVLEYLMSIINSIYTEIGLHYSCVRYGTKDTRKHESMALGILMFSPHSEKYVEVGRISLTRDYVCKRLQAVHSAGSKKTASYLGIFHVEFMNITRFIGCVMENSQHSDGSYDVPPCLRQYMLAEGNI